MIKFDIKLQFFGGGGKSRRKDSLGPQGHIFSTGSSWPRAGLCSSLLAHAHPQSLRPPAVSPFQLPPGDEVLTAFLVTQLFEPCLGQPTFLPVTVRGGSEHLPSPRRHSGCLGSRTSCRSHPAVREACPRQAHAFPESWTNVMLAIPCPGRTLTDALSPKSQHEQPSFMLL